MAKKKKDQNKHVCEECLELFDDVECVFVKKNSAVYEQAGSEFWYWIVNCETCASKKDAETRLFTTRKRKKVIDTSNFVEGEPTAKGNKRYLFINDKGKEMSLLAETGLKKGYKPVLKNS